MAATACGQTRVSTSSQPSTHRLWGIPTSPFPDGFFSLLLGLGRALVTELVARGISDRWACQLVGVHRSSDRSPAPTEPEAEVALRARIRELGRVNPRYGYRQITALLRRQGKVVNPKHVGRTWREAGLVLLRQRPRKRRLAVSGALPTAASARGHVWTDDFVFDRTERGQALKMLVVLDEFTGECTRIRGGRRLDSAAVVAMREEVVTEQEAPTSRAATTAARSSPSRSKDGWHRAGPGRSTSSPVIPGRTALSRASRGSSGTSA
jgi:putative transposase